jgi:hypothetical protein
MSGGWKLAVIVTVLPDLHGLTTGSRGLWDRAMEEAT